MADNPFIRESSIPFPKDIGGDTHIHPYGPQQDDFVITTRIPLRDGSTASLDIHDDPKDFNNW